MSAFDDVLAFVLQSEGGKVDNKKDPGGRTAYGVTQRTFDAWQAAHGLPKRDVWTITQAEVAAVYRNGYFDPVKFDALPAGVGYCVVDEGINSGAHQAILDLQRAVGVKADGAIGMLTLAAVAKADRVALIGKLCDARLTFLRRLKTFVTFGKGWSNRVAFVRAHALAMAQAKVVAAPGPAAATPVLNSILAAVSAAAANSAPSGPAPSLPAPCARLDCPLRAKAA